jgi:CheY-like chemotaxis protein
MRTPIIQKRLADLVILTRLVPAIRRLMPTCGHVPIRALTGRAIPDNAERCRAAGTDRYLRKLSTAAALDAALEPFVGAPRRPSETARAQAATPRGSAGAHPNGSTRT